MRMVASVVSVSDNSKSLKLKSRSRSDWADGTVATFKEEIKTHAGRKVKARINLSGFWDRTRTEAPLNCQ